MRGAEPIPLLLQDPLMFLLMRFILWNLSWNKGTWGERLQRNKECLGESSALLTCVLLFLLKSDATLAVLLGSDTQICCHHITWSFIMPWDVLWQDYFHLCTSKQNKRCSQKSCFWKIKKAKYNLCESENDAGFKMTN